MGLGYTKYFKLNKSGEVNSETLRAMETQRCGVKNENFPSSPLFMQEEKKIFYK